MSRLRHGNGHGSRAPIACARTLFVLATLLLVLSPTASAGPGTPQLFGPSVQQQSGYVTNGVVRAATTSADGATLYIGGDFTLVGPNTGGGSILSATSAARTESMRFGSYDVQASIADGAGGWYVSRGASVVRLRSDGTLDPTFSLTVGGTVTTMLLDGSTLYVGGIFSLVNGVSRNAIAAIDTTTSGVTAWNPNPTPLPWPLGAVASVHSMARSGSTLYVVGGFSAIGGQSRKQIAALSTTTGLATAWSPPDFWCYGEDVNVCVDSVAVSGSNVYVAGAFNMSGRTNLVALASTTAALTAWDPQIDGVPEVTVVGSSLYLNGDFTTAGGQARSSLAEFNTTTGVITSWNPGTDGSVSHIAVSGSTVYVAGAFTTVSGQLRHNLAAIDRGTASAPLSGWIAHANASAQSISVSGGNVFAAGSFQTTSGETRNRLAALNVETQQPTSWNPSVDGTVHALARRANTIYVGGSFETVQGFARESLASVNATTPTVGALDQPVVGQVNALEVVGGRLIVGGSFSSVGGASRTNLARIDSTGTVAAWNPAPNDAVYDLAARGNRIYVGGYFTSIAGATRTGMAAFTAGTGTLLSWNIGSNIPYVHSISVIGSAVFVGGRTGSGTNYVAERDPTTGSLRWASSGQYGWGGGVVDIVATEDAVYVGGDFDRLPSWQARNGLAALNRSGQVTSWNPYAHGVEMLHLAGDSLFVGATRVGEWGASEIAFGFASFPLRSMDVTDGSVHAILPSQGGLLVGGSFSAVGKPTGASALTSPNSVLDSSWPDVGGGTVRAVVSDGQGGWFLGGDFTSVDGLPRSGLARVLSDGRVDHTWAPQPNGTVNALVRSGRTLYVGGQFTTIASASRLRLAAFDAWTGALTAFDVQVNAGVAVHALAISGTTLFVGGQFSTVSGVSRANIASIDTGTGVVNGWNPGTDATVRALVPNGATIYIGGDFLIAGWATPTRFRIAEINTTTGVATAWTPTADGPVNTLALVGTTLYAGGSFANIGGAARARLAALNTTNGLATGWNPSPNGNVSALQTDGTTLYVGGAFTTIAAAARPYAAAFTISTGAITFYAPQPDGQVFAVGLDTKVLLGGSFTSAGYQTVSNLVSLDMATGALSWNYGANGTVRALTRSSNGVTYVGGDFTTLEGQPRAYLAALGKSWTINANDPVRTLAAGPGNLYVGGDFTTIEGLGRTRLAKIDTSTDGEWNVEDGDTSYVSVTGWNPTANATVNSLVVSGSNVLAGGAFANAGGTSRANIAALDSSSGVAVPAWNPGANGAVNDLSIVGSDVQVGGAFTTAASQSRNRIAAISVASGTATSFNPNADGTVNVVNGGSSTTYVGGSFATFGGGTHANVAATYASGARRSGWTPQLNGPVRAIARVNDKVVLGGTFDSVSGRFRRNIVALDTHSTPSAPLHVYPDSPTVSADAVPELAAVFVDPDATDTGQLQFEVCTVATSENQSCASAGGTVTWSGSTASNLPNGASETYTPGLLSHGYHYWHARSLDNAGEWGPWSATSTYLVDVPPNTPAHVAPTNGATTNTTPTLVAQFTDPDLVDTGVLSFEICTVAFSPAQTCAAAGGSLVASGTSASVAHGANGSWTSPVLAVATRHWRVRAQDNLGEWSSWSASTSIVINNAPTTPPHVSPPTTGSTANTTPTFTAQFNDIDTGQTGTLEFEVCTVAMTAGQTCVGAGGSLAASGSSSAGIAIAANGSWTPTLVNGSYHWHVRARDSVNATSPWSASWSINVGPPTIVLNIDNAALNLGTALPDQNITSTSTVTVSTNDISGYTLYASDTNATWSLQGPSDTIDDYTGTTASPTTWTTASGLAGICVLTATGGKHPRWGSGTTPTDFINNQYAGLTTTPGAIHTRTGFSTATDTVGLGLRVRSATDTRGGNYTGTITYTVTANP